MPQQGPPRRRAAANNPCPVCGQTSKSCSWPPDGEGDFYCRGIEGEAPSGWYDPRKGVADATGFRHFRRDDPDRQTREPRSRPSKPATPLVKPSPAKKLKVFTAREKGARLTPDRAHQLAESLALPVEAIGHLGIGWDGEAYTYPECNAAGAVIGISRRLPDGQKRQVSGGQRGLVIFRAIDTPADTTLYIAEGMSDGLALTHAGLLAVSRPSATATEHVAEYIAAHHPQRPVMIVADDDQPGIRGSEALARHLAEALNRPVQWAITPDSTKDARAYLTRPEWGDTPWLERGRQFAEALQASAQTVKPVTAKPNEPQGAEAEDVAPAQAERPWPTPPASEAYYGLAGDIVRTLEPQTEADPVALLVQFLAMFGNVIGRQPHISIGNVAHRSLFNAVIVGSTSAGRKGQSNADIRHVFRDLDPDWLSGRCKGGGTSSAEGLLWQVRDPNEGLEDEGEPDKRLMVVEPEFANVLKQAERQGNVVTVYVRQLFDSPDEIHMMTKSTPIKSTAPHVTVIGHITPGELHRCLTATDCANGFANRFAYICVRRSKFLPFGGEQIDGHELQRLRHQLEAAAGYAQQTGQVGWHPEARPIWEAVYPLLNADRPGMAGELVSRAAPITLRLATIYALLDHQTRIGPRHLLAALALWDYAERSVLYLFGDKTGNTLADEIRELLQLAPQGLTRLEITNAMHRHASGDRLTSALAVLQRAGQARMSRRPAQVDSPSKGGRPAEVWQATEIGTPQESQLLKVARDVFHRGKPSDETETYSPGREFVRFVRFVRNPQTHDTQFFSRTDRARLSPRKPAEVWLVQRLANGPRLAQEVHSLSQVANIGRAQLQAAFLTLGVVVGGSEDAPTWELPPGFEIGAWPTTQAEPSGENASKQPGQAKPAGDSPTTPDTKKPPPRRYRPNANRGIPGAKGGDQ